MEESILSNTHEDNKEKKFITNTTEPKKRVCFEKDKNFLLTDQDYIKSAYKSTTFLDIKDNNLRKKNLCKSGVLQANFFDEQYQTVVISSYKENPIKQKNIKKIFEDGKNEKLIKLSNYSPLVPEKIYTSIPLSKENNKVLKITNSVKTLFLGIKSKELLINQSGLVNHISSFYSYSIFGTSSYSHELIDMLSDCYEQDYIDIYLNYKTNENYQCFYINYNFAINSFIFTSLIDRESKLSKLYIKIDKLRLDDKNKYTFILLGFTLVKIYFTSNPETSPKTFVSTKDEIKEILAIETHNNKTIMQFYFSTFETITFGSSKDNVIVLKDDLSVSKKHCYIKYNQIEGVWILYDGDIEKLNSSSKNGTWLLMEKFSSALIDTSKFIKFDDFIFNIELMDS